MSVLNRFEVSNYLNLDNTEPRSKNWRADHIHTVIAFNAVPTVVVGTNGIGKTTLNQAQYALLTRDRDFTTQTRSVAAPKRNGTYSHIRLEILFQDRPVGGLLSQMEAEVTGEPYVLGMACFSDKGESPLFYAYQGKLEDCPVAKRSGNRISLIPNTIFKENLSSCDPILNGGSNQKDAWLDFVSQHFDMSLLQQLLSYQKEGGGDSAENFFKVKQRRGNGITYDYDTAFFLDHIAPEVLSNAMYGHQEENEVRFEDTIMNSAAPLIRSEIKLERDRIKLEKDRSTFKELENANTNLSDFIEARKRYDAEIKKLAAEVSFILDITQSNPIPGLPRALNEKSEKTQFIANRLVMVDGEWFISDYILADIFDCEAKEVNRLASPIKGREISQVIEISTHLAPIKSGGHPNIAYTVDEAVAICNKRSIYSEGWSQEDAQRAIRYGFEYRQAEGEANPIRKTLNATNSTLSTVSENISEMEESLSKLSDEMNELIERLQTLEADEAELVKCRNSRLFSVEEIENPKKTETELDKEWKIVTGRIAKLHEKNTELKHLREAYQGCLQTWEGQAPQEVLATLQEAVRLSQETETQLEKKIQDLANDLTDLIKKAKGAEEVFELRQKEAIELEQCTEQAREYLSVFGDQSPEGLEEKVTADRDDIISRISSLNNKLSAIKSEREELDNLFPKWEEFLVQFPDETSPDGLEVELEKSHSETKNKISNLENSLSKISEKIDVLEDQQINHDDIRKRFDCPSLIGLEENLRNELNTITDDFKKQKVKLDQAIEDKNTIQNFEKVFPKRVLHEVVNERKEQYQRKIIEQEKAQGEKERYEKQLLDLDISPLSAGRFAKEVHDIAGPDLASVHQVISDTLNKDEKRRKKCLTLFSHVLHFPVVNDLPTANKVLSAIEKAGIEAPIFWEKGLVEYCKNQNTTDYNLLCGQETLQVKGIFDPNFIEQQKSNLQGAINSLAERIDTLSNKIEELSAESATGLLLQKTEFAIQKGEFLKIDTYQNELKALAEKKDKLESSLKGEQLSFIRLAERFETENKAQELAVAKETKVSKETEFDDLKKVFSQLCEQKQHIPTIQKAALFQDKGGQERLSQIEHDIHRMGSELSECEVKKETLDTQFFAIHLIRPKRRFDEIGGDEAVLNIGKEIATLKTRKNETETALLEAQAKKDELNHQFFFAKDEVTRAVTELGENKPVLKDAILYLEKDGIAFDGTFQNDLAQEEELEHKCRLKNKFDFEQIARAINAEKENITSRELIDKRNRIKQEAEVTSEKLSDCRKRKERLTDKAHSLDKLTDKLDSVAASFCQLRRLAYMVRSDAELSSQDIENAEIGSSLSKAQIYLNEIRAMSLDEDTPFEELVERLEELESDTRGFSVFREAKEISKLRTSKDNKWADYNSAIDELVNNKELSLTATDKRLLNEAQNAVGTVRFEEVFRNFETHLGASEAQHEAAEKDIGDQNKFIAESLHAFALRVDDNFKLLKTCLKPKNQEDAGFIVEAEIVGKDGIEKAVSKVIQAIRLEEEGRSKQIDLETSIEDNDEYEDRVKDIIRKIFYTSVFVGTELDKEDKKNPRIYLRHPYIGGGKKILMTKKISTGQSNALALLLLTKMADFTLSRDEKLNLEKTGRRRGSVHQTRVVIIDGLFSNVSNRRLIKESLAAMRDLRGKFQLIGWVHNEAYENDVTIFPTYVGLRRTGHDRGFVVVDDDPDGEGDMPHSGSVANVAFQATPVEGVEQ